jgi:hypothetical protein
MTATGRQKYFESLKADAAPAKRAPAKAPAGVDDELLRERRLRNDDIAQDIQLKKRTLNYLFLFLLGETALIFGYSFLQATQWFGFGLEDWSFKLLVTATLAQITGMLYVAVRYLFPKKRGE